MRVACVLMCLLSVIALRVACNVIDVVCCCLLHCVSIDFELLCVFWVIAFGVVLAGFVLCVLFVVALCCCFVL